MLEQETTLLETPQIKDKTIEAVAAFIILQTIYKFKKHI